MLSRRNRAVLVSPIINKVVELNNYMIHHGKQAYKIVQHNYIDAMPKDGCTLFRYARRQLLGKDYAKRTVELCEELEAMAYFVAALKGWPPKVAGDINVMTEEIVAQVMAHANSQNHKPDAVG